MTAATVARIEIAAICCDGRVVELRLLNREANVDRIVGGANFEFLHALVGGFQQFGEGRD